jgi:hypothetical protein
MTHGYKRPGTTTLFAALNVLDRSMIGRCMQGHSHREFISLLNAVERQAPAGVVTPSSNKLRHPPAPQGARMAGQPSAGTFHFTSTNASWLNAVEGFFSALTRRG